MEKLTFEEKVRRAGYRPNFSSFENRPVGEFYRFGPNKAHWMIRNQNGSVTCGDWFERLPRIHHGRSAKQYEHLNKDIYGEKNLESGYLSRKGVLQTQKHLSGVLIAKDHLCAPIYDLNGVLLSYQKIYDDGKKKFFTGYSVKGGHYIIGDLRHCQKIIFCEGLATGCSLFLSTQLPVIITFGINNLRPVIEGYRKLFPEHSFLIASDKGNCEKTAEEVASLYECYLAVPNFKEFSTDAKHNDFNDLHQLSNLSEVQSQIDEAFTKLPLQQNFPLLLLEDCFDEEQVVYKKYRITTAEIPNEIWIKGEDFADKKKIEGILKKYDLFFEPQQTQEIIKFMQKKAPIRSNIMNNECGWRDDGSFYLPPLEKICVNTHYKPFIRKGNILDFKKDIFTISEKNPLITFILSYSFLPLFIKDFSINNFGIHLYGEGSTGKTTLLKLAASIWGTPLEQWNGTLVGFEDLAYRYKDTLFCLDEINQIKIENLYQVIYMLGNGGGRIRFRSKDIFQSRSKFRINYLSTGEASIKDKLKNDFTGGHLVRILDINCHRSINNAQGIFDHSEDSKKDIHLIEDICMKYQNIAIDHLIKNFKEAKGIFPSFKISNPYGGQLGRIKDSFIAIERAGLTAKALGCLPDLPISKHIEKIFLSLNIKENSSHEVEIAKQRIYSLLVEGEAFFYTGIPTDRIPYKIKGYKQGNLFFLTIPTLKYEICDSINYLSVKNKLIRDNIIEEIGMHRAGSKVFRGYKINELWFEQYGE